MTALLALAICATATVADAGVCGGMLFRVDAAGEQAVPRNVHVLVSAGPPYLGLIEDAEIQFVAEQSSIPAKVVRRIAGAYAGQLLLAPTTDLLPRTRYFVSFAPRPSAAAQAGPGAVRELNEWSQRSFGFTTLDERDDTPPVWQRSPRLGRYEYATDHKSTMINAFRVKARLGAGFQGYVVAHIEARTRSEPPLDAIFVVQDESTLLGQLDCDPVFRPRRGTYAVTLSALDLGGNSAPAPGEPLLLWFGK